MHDERGNAVLVAGPSSICVLGLDGAATAFEDEKEAKQIASKLFSINA
jgi:hypothetical protein